MPAPEFRPATLVAIDVVTQALALTRHGVAESDIAVKNGRDVVTAVDVAVEDAIRSTMAATLGHRPDPRRGARRRRVERQGRRPTPSGNERYKSNGRHRRWEVEQSSSAYVAAGRIAAYAVFWVTVVHAGAGVLLVTEAGGTVSDIDGRPWTIHADSLLASANPRLHDEMLALARGRSRV